MEYEGFFRNIREKTGSRTYQTLIEKPEYIFLTNLLREKITEKRQEIVNLSSEGKNYITLHEFDEEYPRLQEIIHLYNQNLTNYQIKLRQLPIFPGTKIYTYQIGLYWG